MQKREAWQILSNKPLNNKRKKKDWIKQTLILIALVLSLLINVQNSLAFAAKNTLIIESLDLNYQPLYGFAYRIYDEDTGALVAKVDLSEDYRASVELADGEYRICEVQRPFNYIEMPDKIVKFPYFIRYGQITRTLIVYPKHKLEVGPPQPHTKVGKTGELGDDEEVMRYGLVLIAISISLYVLYREFSKDADLEEAYVIDSSEQFNSIEAANSEEAITGEESITLEKGE